MDKLVLYDKKWLRFLHRLWLFSYIPFIERVYASGSLVLGRLKDDSDFDVLIVVKKERLYTARFFCLALFKLFGWRPSKHIKKDRFCFNHFVTSDTFPASHPYTDYDKELYSKIYLVIERNIDSHLPPANAVALRAGRGNDSRSGNDKLGEILEKFLKFIQIKKINKNIKKYGNNNSRIFFNDDEVRLWFWPKSVISKLEP